MLASKVSASNTDNAGEGAEATSDDLLAAGATALRLIPEMTASIEKFRHAIQLGMGQMMLSASGVFLGAMS